MATGWGDTGGNRRALLQADACPITTVTLRPGLQGDFWHATIYRLFRMHEYSGLIRSFMISCILNADPVRKLLR